MPTFKAAEQLMHSDTLQCRWKAWRVVGEDHLALELAADNCCSMRGAIKIATALCPTVWRIDTYSGGKPDTTYTRLPTDSNWQAHDMRGAA